MTPTRLVKLQIDANQVALPMIKSTAGADGIDISKLKASTGLVTMDPGFANTGSCVSSISLVDGDKGILRYRGYDIEELAAHCSFVEVAYLLIRGNLPNQQELHTWSERLNKHSLIHEDMKSFFNRYPPNAHPMSILSAMVTSLASFYPHIMQGDPNFDTTAARLIAKVRTIAAFSYKKSQGDPVVYPRQDLPYCANFLNMMFDSPVKSYVIVPEVIAALNQLLILHADHEQNCSTSAVRLVASSGANLYASIAAGISALWGPLHGGANQAVIEMLTSIQTNGGDVHHVIERAKDKTDPFRLMGFGHAVYKSYDPRAKITKQLCDTLLPKLNVHDPLLEIALELEQAALRDDYFVERKLYPNVDFYSGILYRAMGIPTNMLTVMFAIGRLPGWIAHWKEATESKDQKIWRPRQIYIGPTRQKFVAIDKR